MKAFTQYFEALTGYTPLRWQTRLFERMATGVIPSACDLPTGLGKTLVVPIWLISLAIHDKGAEVGVPRRLVYIVNRRTVVDQATSVVEGMRSRLRNPEDARWITHKQCLDELSSRLRALCAMGGNADVLAISTLRGEMADNEEWKADPARPAIIVGTIDMVGSKLLFSGYGDGRYRRAHHAGLIGQDVLIIHDEAHLTPAFSTMLCAVASFQAKDSDPRSVRVMELSATRRDHAGGDVFGLVEAEDEKDSVVADRLGAKKYMRLHRPVLKSDFVRKIIDLAREHEEHRAKVLIYVRSPETAQEIASQLTEAAKNAGSDAQARVAVLTGTIRGYERDKLICQVPTRYFLDGSMQDRTVYLVSTSAGEVGIDLDADHMVCDVTTLDSMVQRLGRVNRRGGNSRTSRIDVVIVKEQEEKKDTPLLAAIRATEGILEKWLGDSREIGVGPGKLAERMATLNPSDRESAFSPTPRNLPLTDILLDGWSLTSVDELPGRPEVAAYLHGISPDPPETYVAWRKEVRLLSEAEAAEEALGDWFQTCRIRPGERLRDETGRVREKLSNLLKAHRKQQKNETLDFPVVVLNERGQAVFVRNESGEAMQPCLSQIRRDDFPLDYKTIVLPIEVGGLDEHGMLTASPDKLATELDVAEREVGENKRERWIHVRGNGAEYYENLLTGEIVAALPQKLRERGRVSLREAEEGAEEIKTRELVLLTSRAESALEAPESVRFEQKLAEHTNLIVAHAERIADSLGLDSRLKGALVMAAKWHDQGKKNRVWQQYACNANGKEPLAKAGKYLNPRALGGYRHEFGSLLRAEASDELRDHSERDLTLHLIAAHHGWARPHFENRSFSNEGSTTAQNEECAVQVIRRFGRLQQRFGLWGLAWIESLLRCADIAASMPTADEDATANSEALMSS
jgi:CRISPR-associated endonuclease/helicase Cas3